MFSAFDTVSADSSTIYVNDSGGNDDWDGQYAEWIKDTLSGPKKSIKNGIGTVTEGGTVNIADGKYTGINNTNVVINKNMTIIGQSRESTVINGSGSSQIFVVQSGKTVTITNLTIVNGTAWDGGAIYNNGNLSVNHCNFTSNAAGLDGGAIYNYYGILSVDNSIFEDNTASWNGGAICNYYGTSHVAGSIFINNTASWNGGAVNNDHDNLNITGSTFINNTASWNGGAIANDKGIATIESSIFTGNSATNSGNAISNDGTAEIHFNRIIGNGSNSIIYCYGGSVDAENNWWGSNDNPSGKVAGSVDCTPWLILNISASPSTISTSGNSITADLTHNSNGEDTSSQGHILDGIPVVFGGTFGSINPESVITSNGIATTTFMSNKLGLANISATVDSQTVNNQMTAETSNIYVSPTGNDNTGNGTKNNPYQTILKGITMVFIGGIVHIADGTYTGVNNTDLVIDRDMIIQGQSKDGTIIDGANLSRIFTIQRGINVTIQNLTLINGKANSGGAIYNNNWAILTIKNITFTGNTASSADSSSIYGGGAIYNSQGILVIENSTFKGNTACLDGGAILNWYGTSNITNSIFMGNTANDAYGGAIYHTGALNITNCTFSGNIAGYGGAIYNDYDSVFGIEGCILNVTHCIFTNNKGKGHGGAIYNDRGTAIINDSVFTVNTAGYGGAIINMARGTLTVTNSTFTSNHDNAISNAGGLTVNKCVFNGNTANCGGAITNTGSLTVNGSDFTGNTAINYGGAIQTYGGVINVNFNRFLGNSAYSGNDIYGSPANVDYNWWGSNAGPSAGSVYDATVNSWLVLTLNANPSIIKANGLSTLTADLLHDNHGNYYDPALGHVPDGITVNFNTDLGIIGSSSSLVNGIAQSTLNGGLTSGVAHVSAAVDSQTVNTFVTVDAIPPTVSSIDPTNNAKIKIVNKEIKITFSEPIQAGSAYNGVSITGPSGVISITKSISGNVLTLTPTSDYVDGVYSVNMPVSAITDLAGNDLAAAFDSTFTVDTIAPTVSSNDPSNNAKIKVTDKAITITFSEPIQAGSAYDGISVTGPSGTVLMSKSINGNVLTLTPISNYVDGFYSVNIPIDAVTDLTGNGLAVPFAFGFTVDATKPTVNANSIGGLFNTSQSVLLVANDNLDPNPVIYYTTDGGITWNQFTGSGTVLISNEGVTNLEFYALDATGNPSAHTTYSYTIDKTVPVVTASSTGGLSNTGINVVLSSETDAKIYYKINGGLWNTFTGSGTVSIANEGINNLEFYAVDAAGNPSAHINYSYTIDKTAPVVTATPTSGLANSISVTLSSESNAKIYYRINSGPWYTFTGSGKVLISSAGTNKLEFYAVDAAGNPSAHKIYTYAIDKTAPKVSATSPKNGATGVSRTATISIKLSENILKSIKWSKIYIKNMKTGAKYKVTTWISGNHLYIKTNAKRVAYTSYQVYIPASSVKDSSGNNLAATYAFKFKTGKY